MDDIWRAFASEDIGLPMLSSLVTGILIGLERELHAKPAGLRTHALVCFASTILMLAAARQAEWFVELLPDTQVVTDPTRMAHGVLTGIGFLCAGVIFREGATVHGLTTAASLWSTAAIGTLYGVGMYWLAVSSALATLFVLALLRIVQHLMPQRIEMRVEIVSAGGDFNAATLRRLASERGLRVKAIRRAGVRAGALRLVARIQATRDADLDDLVAVLSQCEHVVSFDIEPAEHDAASRRGAARRDRRLQGSLLCGSVGPQADVLPPALSR
jgi:putative Mg2+ transporter-C (MgtC) family protein